MTKREKSEFICDNCKETEESYQDRLPQGWGLIQIHYAKKLGQYNTDYRVGLNETAVQRAMSNDRLHSELKDQHICSDCREAVYSALIEQRES